MTNGGQGKNSKEEKRESQSSSWRFEEGGEAWAKIGLTDPEVRSLPKIRREGGNVFASSIEG